ncbi:MAG: uracil-DNA glycosylase [Candidatus Omnitrophota bacterium]
MTKLKEIVFSIESFLEQQSNYGIDEYFSPAEKKVMPKKEFFRELEEKVKQCKLCGLYKEATNAVFGEGNTRARLMFVGEGPGRDEDLQGRPFVGRAGNLLAKIIEAMGYTREDVYIANVVKHRPPQNRNPQPEEIRACLPYLLFQIEFIKPAVICALGKWATETLLGEEKISISQVRGKFQSFNLVKTEFPIKIMPTYHPAYLLRNPSAKKEVWADIKEIMQYLKEYEK